jgi:glycosyltransferase involved in cell wall biosynthesis
LASEAKHIVIVGPAYPFRGGLATYNQLLASKLVAQGHRVELVTFTLQYPSLFFPGKTQYSSEEAPSDLLINKRINSINPLNWLKVGRQLARQKPDLVIFRYWMPFMAPAFGTIARLIRGNSKSKVVAITDNIIPHERRPMDRWFTSYFLRSCDGFVSMSRAVLQDLLAFELDKPALFHAHPMYESFGAPLSKSEARSQLDLKADGKYLLFFGFIRAYKGLDLLLEAMADQRLEQEDVQLIIAGEYYEDAARYKALMKEKGLEERIVERTHFIPDSEVRAYFCACDMVVQTYKHATQSGVTQVAYFYERPMLVTDVGGLAELVPDQEVGYVCPVDVKSVADALVDFYTLDREAEFSQGVRQGKKKFSWEGMIKSLFQAGGLD